PSEPLPLITSISPTAGPIGTRVELKGTGFSGFEGDKYAWIENPKTGVKGIIYNEAGATNNLIPFVLKDKYCTRDNSYSGNPCESYLTITPGEYTIHVYPWGKISNKIKFTVTN
ncbi:MAG: IPT/TIG domain-containing protein, partial [Patescibacteria group bacterium]